eukprot:11108666-Alexandrium_andersonii.AAC.1
MNCRTSKPTSGARSSNCTDPRKASNVPPCKASSAGFGAMLRAGSDNETGWRARQRRLSGWIRDRPLA